MNAQRKHDLDQLFESNGELVEPNFIDLEGYHLYVNFNLELKVSAGDKTDATKYLKYVQALSKEAERLGFEFQAELLEVQNDKLHLVFPGGADDRENDIIEFSKALHASASEVLKTLVGKSLRSLKYTATHGRAIILNTGSEATDSTVSLGPAANEPAKRLYHKDFLSGTLHYSKKAGQGSWTIVDLSPSLDKIAAANARLFNRIDTLAASDLCINESLQFPSQPVSDPFVTQGFVMRADLDGFTQQVKDAFESNDEEVISLLVERFVSLMGFSKYFANTSSDKFSVSELPWSGDCTNMVIVPHRTYDMARKSVPVLAASKWFEIKRSRIPKSRQIWSDLMNDADWCVSIAGGGKENDETNGSILVADIEARERKFRIAAGWGSRRSLDAQNAKVIYKNDTVVPYSDRTALEKQLAELFTPCSKTPTYYRKANLKKDDITRASEKVEVPSIFPSNIITPKPRPYYK